MLVGAATGVARTVTDVVYTVDGAQPVPTLLTFSEYTPEAVGAIVGFCKEEVNPDGPAHDQAVAAVEFELSVKDPPSHIGPLLVAPDDVGTGLIVTVTLPCCPQHPAAESALK